jgi:hypothetical protein
MKQGLARQLFAFCLAVFLAVGMSASAVQASVMVAKAAMGSEMGAAGMGSDMGAAEKNCDGCKKGSDGKAMFCSMPACTASAFATLPQAEPAAMAQIAVKLPLPPTALLLGSTPPPDPYPPRPIVIG